MRSLLSSLFGRETGADQGEAVRGRPELLRRDTIAVNARIIIVASVLAAPAALFYLVQGMSLPFVVSVIGLAAGFATLALHRRGQYERAAFGQVYATLVIGLVLTLADPQVVDFGVAVALLAPVQASLLSRSPNKKRAWVLLLAVVAIGAIGSLGFAGWPAVDRSSYAVIAIATFTLTALMVAYATSRLNTAFAVYERGQMNAYRHLVENVQDAVMRFSADGSVLFTSRSAEKLFGCQRYELGGSGVLERVHVLDRPAYMTAFADANRDGRTRMVEVRMRRDDPAEPSRIPQFIWVEISMTPVIDPQLSEDRHEVVALLRNVTDRHAHEIEMREARRAAEDASSAKSRFLATIGHELRTPLNAIVGFSEMMTSGVVGELSPAHREYAGIIHQSGHHLLDVVKMLLDMSRLEAGKFELQTEAFDPAALVEPCFKMVETMARARQVQLVSDLPKLLPQLTADERAVRQIVINLLSNAVKFSQERGVVTLSIKRQGSLINISVADRGIGMDSDAVSRIGEPFFQVQDGLARRYEGTGLGLSIVKGLVDLHDGTLKAISSPGEGTTITVLLPLNGPATKRAETAEVTPLVREPQVAQTSQWHEEKRRAL
ncbi:MULTISPECIES: PAS domain-containing sensor histidine kinase [unclassified Devosia]|uniref:sensor histidine kinase n=1 Tax=unclassified Devosia TaxID=196773 RepID=UPI000B142826|nr:MULTISPECIES: PAS domain-containing sensor histidine kinase [unclassified Devosia]MBN9305619.1 PAS domain-containing sensor histidine kinase [Devosia sp.]